jgi:hypothetical protein
MSLRTGDVSEGEELAFQDQSSFLDAAIYYKRPASEAFR